MADISYGDWWSRLPGVARALIAIGTIVGATIGGTMVVQEVTETPAGNAQAIGELEETSALMGQRLDTLEHSVREEMRRQSARFVYLACVTRELDGCEFVLPIEDRQLLSNIRAR